LNAMPQQAKKPYQKPALKVYGDIRTVTGTHTKSFTVTDGINMKGNPIHKTL